MNSFIQRWLMPLLLLLTVALGDIVYKIAYDTGRAPLLLQIAQMQTLHETEKNQLLAQAAAATQDAARRGDRLSHTLLQRAQQITRLTKEKNDAILKATVGQPCFYEPALRVLNTAPGLHVNGLDPATATPNSTLATGGRIATDTDFGQWAIDAGAAFEVCRTRLDALIDWHTLAPLHH